MPILKRAGHPDIHYALDDFTDPWRDSPVLILQHGNGRSGRFWYRWVPYLARHYRVVRPDLRGLGQSGKDFDLQRDLTVETLIGDLVAIIDAVGAQRVHYCGESMGGILGLALAAAHPERLRTLTLVATPVYISEDMKRRYSLGAGSRTEAMRTMGIRAWADATTRGTRLPADAEPDLYRWYIEEFTRNDADVQVAMSDLVNRTGATALLDNVVAPVLGLYPTGGQITSAEQEALLKSRLKQFELVHLPSGYHMVHLLFPRECARRTLEFCARHDGISIDEP